MAKESKSGVTEVKTDAGTKATRVAWPENVSDEFYQRQDEALRHYKITGEVGEFLDPLRDQEPDIAPEIGVAPHPELANPAPPKQAISAVPSASPVVTPVEDKEEADNPDAARGLAAGNAVTPANPEGTPSADSNPEDAKDGVESKPAPKE